jgi:general secretion pathway protein C
VRRAGDQLGALAVVFVGYNAVESSPAVWFASSESVCQAVLFDETPRARPRQKAPAPPAKPALKPPRRGPSVPAEVASKIKRLGPNEFAIERAAIDVIMAGYSSMLRGTRIKPVQRDGTVRGISLQRILQGSLLEQLGLQNGDEVQSINGFALTSPEQALKAYARLRTASSLRVSVVRNGRPVTLEYRIR